MRLRLWIYALLGATAFAGEFDPPNEVVLKEPVTLQVDLGEAKAGVKFPVGTMLEVLAVEGESIVLKKNNAQGSVPITATDYESRLREVEERKAAAEAEKMKAQQAAEDLRQANEEMEKNRLAKMESLAGEKPFVSVDALTGEPVIPSAMRRHIKMRLKDPDSFKPREVAAPVLVEKDGVACWKIVLLYGAKNGFGGYTTNIATAYMKGSTLLALSLAND